MHAYYYFAIYKRFSIFFASLYLVQKYVHSIYNENQPISGLRIGNSNWIFFIPFISVYCSSV